MLLARPFLRRAPWSVRLGGLGFLLAFWALHVWLPPLPRLIIDVPQLLHPIEITSDGMLVLGPDRRGGLVMRDNPLDFQFWDVQTGDQVFLQDEQGRRLEYVVETIGRGALLLTEDGPPYRRRERGVYVRRELPEGILARHGQIAGWPDGPRFAANTCGHILVADCQGPEQRIIDVQSTSMALSAGGMVLATGDESSHVGRTEDTAVVVWDTRHAIQRHRFEVCPGQRITDLKLSASGRYLVCLCRGPFDPADVTKWNDVGFVWDVGTGD